MHICISFLTSVLMLFSPCLLKLQLAKVGTVFWNTDHWKRQLFHIYCRCKCNVQVQMKCASRQEGWVDMYKTHVFCLYLLYCEINSYKVSIIKTRGQSNLTKSASRGSIPRLGVTPGGRKLYGRNSSLSFGARFGYGLVLAAAETDKNGFDRPLLSSCLSY